jgi:soluble lytic murein transglycosylase
LSTFVLGILVSAAAAGAAPGASSAQAYWLQAAPESPEEVALRQAVEQGASSPAAAAAETLRRVTASHPGTAASGLAELCAGLLLLDDGKAADALPFLHHADVALTALADHALFAEARVLEAGQKPAAAAEAYLAAASAGSGTLACDASFRAADAFGKAGQGEKALPVLERALATCPGQEPRALLATAEILDRKGDRGAAVLVYDRLDKEYPASAAAKDGAVRLHALVSLLPARPPAERASRQLKKGLALFDAGRNADAAAVLRGLETKALSPEDAELAQVRLGRALVAMKRLVEAERALGATAATSPLAAEAAYYLAKIKSERLRSIVPFETVADKFAGTPWGEEALLALANNYQKDSRHEEALPYYRRVLESNPDGRYVDRATWRVGWAEYRAGRYEEAAQVLEKAARLRPSPYTSPAFLYWSGRARAALGQMDRARQLLGEAVQRYKHTYHGLRALEALQHLPLGPASAPVALMTAGPSGLSDIPEPSRTRIRQLLLIERLDEAQEELKAQPFSPTTEATIAWIDWKRGRLRSAIIAMKRAYPQYVSEAGDRLPPEVWRILFPLQFSELLQAKSAQAGLDPALVAALVCQESTFDAGAVSRAGARGLMQVIPTTGRKLARDLGVRYQRASLHNPETSLGFGTRYLRQMMDRFGGQIERVLAAYNAGPHRVDAWTALRPDMPAEEFVESIPFTETRYYVMTILASREHYRRLYGLALPAPLAASAGTRP